MKLIAHRGNTNGPSPLDENKPEYIEEAINNGYDVEIDVRYNPLDNNFYLGHDEPQYVVNLYWLAKHVNKLWIHCKDINALNYFVSRTSGYNYFWHQEDDFTLTSKNYIWTYPGKTYTPSSIIVMPEWNLHLETFDELRAYNCFGVCSDHVGRLK